MRTPSTAACLSPAGSAAPATRKLAEEIETQPQSGGWLTFAVTLVLLAGALEIGIRYVPPDISVLGDMVLLVDEPVGYRMKPNLDVAFDGLFEPLPNPIRWQTNAQGHRRDGLIEPDTHACRIATFGDSETFGWSVELEDTFQARLETSTEDLQVLNFGVPGYNTTNIAMAMADLVPRYQPDQIIYLFNNNDFDPPIEVAATFFRSHLLGRIRYLWQVWATREERKRIRESAERRMVAAADLAEIAATAEAAGAALNVAFMRWRNWSELQPYLDEQHPLNRGLASGRVQVLNAEPALSGIPELDDHLAPEAHRNLTTLFVEAGIHCQSDSRVSQR